MEDEPLTLSPAELAVVFQHLIGRDAASQHLLSADMDFDESELEAARRSLIERGLLIANPRRSDTALAFSLEPVLRTITRPAALGILQVSRPGLPARTINISWAEGNTVANWIDETGRHVIEPLASVREVGEAAVGWTAIGSFTPRRGGEAIDPESVVRLARQRAVFMAVGGVLEDEQHAQAVSWITGDDALWLIDGRRAGSEPALVSVSASDVAEAVRSLMEGAVADATERAASLA
jgi:hypothetical protein